MRRDTGTTRQPSRCFEFANVERQALLFGHVDQVERDHRRPAQLEHLAGEKQIAFEIGRSRPRQDRRRAAVPGSRAVRGLDGDPLVGRDRFEAVEARQIDERRRVAVNAHRPRRCSTVVPGKLAVFARRPVS